MNVALRTKREAGPKGPAPSVLSPAATLGVLFSRALSFEQARREYCIFGEAPMTNCLLFKTLHRDVTNAKNFGGLGAEPPASGHINATYGGECFLESIYATTILTPTGTRP